MLESIVNFDEMQSIIRLLNLFRKLELLRVTDYLVAWESKPQMILGQMGSIEYETVEEVYGCSISFYDENGKEVSRTRYKVLC